MSMKSNLDLLNEIRPDAISTFFATGEAGRIPEEIQTFLMQLQWAAEEYEFERNITRAAQGLRKRVSAIQKIPIALRTCKARIYDAITYFHVDDNVPIKVWEANFADKYEDLAKLSVARGDYKTAKQCMDQSLDCKRRSAEIAQADANLGVTFLITPDISPEQLGFTKKSIKEIARKNNEGFYLKLIDSLPIDSGDKKRLLRDSDIQDAQIIEEINEE